MWIRYAKQKARDAADAADYARVQAARIAARHTDPLQVIGTVANLVAVAGPVAISLYCNACCDENEPVPPEVKTAKKVVKGIGCIATELDRLNAQRADFDARYGNGNLAPSLDSLARRYPY